MTTNMHTFILHRHNANSKNLEEWEREDTVVKAPKQEEGKTHIFRSLILSCCSWYEKKKKLHTARLQSVLQFNVHNVSLCNTS